MYSTIGYITLNNYDKSHDFMFAYICIAVGMLLGLGMLRIVSVPAPWMELNQECLDFISKSQCIALLGVFLLFICNVRSSLLLNLIYAFIIASVVLYHSKCFLPWGKLNVKTRRILERVNVKSISNIVLSTICLFLVYNKLQSSIQNEFYILFGLIVIILLRIVYGFNFLVSITLALFVRSIYDGPFFINDAFHNSEFFNYIYSDKAVWPNIGKLEELLPFFFNKIIQIFSLHSQSVSLATSRSFVSLALFLGTYVILYRKLGCYATLAILVLPGDRISLQFAIFYALLLLNFGDTKNIYRVILLIVGPIVVFNIHPLYGLIVIFSSLYIAPKFSRKEFLFITVIASCMGMFWIEDIFEYLRVYASYSTVNTIAYSLPFFNGIFKDYVIKGILYVSFGSMVIITVRSYNARFFYKILLTGSLCFYVISVVGYTMVRVDPGPSRILSTIASFSIVFIYLNSKFYLPYALFSAVVVLAYPGFASPIGINPAHRAPYDNIPYISLDGSNSNTVTLLNNCLKSRKVILFAEPALHPFLNSILPPFTTPYVTVGEYAEKTNIHFFEQNPQTPIYLGSSMTTYDGVDIRARSPNVFKFLSKNYHIEKCDNFIFAVPGYNTIDSSALYSQFDLKESIRYYTNIKYSNSIIYNLDCTVANNSGSYKIETSDSNFNAELSCGLNYIPKFLLHDDNIKVVHQ